MSSKFESQAMTPRNLMLVFIASLAMGAGVPALAQEDLLNALFADLPTEPQALADKIVRDVESIRGLQFQRDISVSNQSAEDFEAFLASEMDRSMPPERADVFGRVVQKVGLYAGPLIEDTVGLITMLATSQAAAYYNPEQSAFFVLLQDAPMGMLAPIYAHELYHGLQDQHWDLNRYLLDGLEAGLNDDELMARQAVVEGEATYIMTLWMMREMTGQVPSGFALDFAVQMQSQLDSNSLRELAATSVVPGSLSENLEASIDAMDEIPQFMLESLIGVYLKGMGFVHQVVRGDWQMAEQLYTNPPQSTEQILHPEKWLLERDEPKRIDFGRLSTADELSGWTQLDSNVIGEFQWRTIFNEFGLSERAEALAAGWDGDRFAVFERDAALLLFLYTTWDSEAEAREFAAAYEELLLRKYPGQDEPTAVVVDGSDVLIVEGGDTDATDGLVALLASETQIGGASL